MLNSLRRKHLLVDTNLLITIGRYLEQFDPFLSQLRQLEVASVVDDAIVFEFLRGCSTPEDLATKRKLLSTILGSGSRQFTLSVTSSNLETARLISNIYVRNHIQSRQISAVDCLIAAQLQKYGGQKELGPELYLATLDHQDFPLCLFDRIYLEAVDLGANVATIGIYLLNQGKFSRQSRLIEGVEST